MELDKIDRQILETLQKRGRISNQELADAVNLSPSPCLRRGKHGYIALVNARKMGLTLLSFIQIVMDKHTPERFEKFDNAIAAFPEVLESHLITGQSADYLLKVIVKDMDDFQQFLLNKLTRVEGVSGVHSSFVLKSPRKSTAIPV